MVQENLKRQVRYKDEIYDILKDITLGNHNYLIIGKGSDSKFFDVDFVEQKVEEGKIKYVSPSMNIQFSANLDFSRAQGQALMMHIVNSIKDGINQGDIIDADATIKYIDNTATSVERSDSIKQFFVNNNSYDTEEKFEQGINTLINYFDLGMKDYSDNKLPAGDVVVPEHEIKSLYEKIGDTQNFGASFATLLTNQIEQNKNIDEYVVDPTNKILVETTSNTIFEDSVFAQSKESELNGAKQDETISLESEKTTEAPENATAERTKTDHELSFQEKLYLENEKRMLESSQVHQADLQTDLGGKVKTLSFQANPSRMNNAAYVSMSFLLYLIGSFELFISIMLLARL